MFSQSVAPPLLTGSAEMSPAPKTAHPHPNITQELPAWGCHNLPVCRTTSHHWVSRSPNLPCSARQSWVSESLACFSGKAKYWNKRQSKQSENSFGLETGWEAVCSHKSWKMTTFVKCCKSLLHVWNHLCKKFCFRQEFFFPFGSKFLMLQWELMGKDDLIFYWNLLYN